MTCNSWHVDPLAADIHNHLRHQEFSFPTFYGQSKQLSMRRYLVDWLAVVCERLELCDLTYHLSVCLLDYFMDNCDVHHGYLHLASLSCLQLAAKFEEGDTCVPRVCDLNRFIPTARDSSLPDSYSHKEYLSMELAIFTHFSCSIAKVTVAHYVAYYTRHLVADGDYIDGVVAMEPELLHPCCLKFIKYFQDLSVQNWRLREFRPSTVAAACAMATRIALHLTPVWPRRLEVVTSSCFEELQTCVYDLLSCSEIGVHVVEDMKSACLSQRTD